jgi:hypothetical protein
VKPPPEETPEQAVKRLVAARTEQGLPPTIENPVALDKAAAIFGAKTD